MAFRRKTPAPVAPPPPPAVPPPRRTPWLLYLLLVVIALVGANYLGCPVLYETESTEWVE